jgi:hypothetical protein
LNNSISQFDHLVILFNRFLLSTTYYMPEVILASEDTAVKKIQQSKSSWR